MYAVSRATRIQREIYTKRPGGREVIECCCFCERSTPAYRLALKSLRLKAELEDQCFSVSI